nr:c-type cytochrome [Saprospiraceae bacterium]
EESKAIKITILNTLQRYDTKVIGQGVLKAYPQILREDTDVRLAALNLLISRPFWINLFLDQIQGTMVIHATDVPIEMVNQVQHLNNEQINKRINEIWPSSVLSSSEEKTQEMKKLAGMIRLSTANKGAGKVVFKKACGICHRMFNEGGDIGPDLSGYDRSNLQYLLVQIVDPSADIREGYVNYVVKTKDGRTISGFLTSRSEKNITLKPYGGSEISLSMDEIEKMEPQKQSLMPEGILERLSDQEVQDLFAYVMVNGKV